MCAGASHVSLVSQTLTFAHSRVTAPSRMTLNNLLSQMGIGTKQLTDRYSGEYEAPVQDQHIYYAYEPSPPSHGHSVSSSKHHYSSGGLKTNASMSALTLLAFLFFLHILQQCIKEHMTEMSSTNPVVVMSSSREGNDALSKAAPKIDKTGVPQLPDYDIISDSTENYETNPFKRNVKPDEKMMKINTAEHKPKVGGKIYGYVYKNDGTKSSIPSFVSAMNGD